MSRCAGPHRWEALRRLSDNKGGLPYITALVSVGTRARVKESASISGTFQLGRLLGGTREWNVKKNNTRKILGVGMSVSCIQILNLRIDRS